MFLLFLLINFQFIFTGFRELLKIVLIPKHKIEHWENLKKTKIAIDNEIRLWLGFAEKNI
jgi:hypothetical protein